MSTVYARTTGTSTVEYTDPVISPLPITVNGSSVVTLEVFEGAILSNPSNRAVNNNGGTVFVTGATFAGNTVTGRTTAARFSWKAGPRR
ncbi:MAG: hypothetical protein MR051_03990 [Lentisphaeria bacterium]|nr:hypothetical protein [Lentisphaeria bacterium]